MDLTFNEWLHENYSQQEIDVMSEDDIAWAQAEYNCECALLGNDSTQTEDDDMYYEFYVEFVNTKTDKLRHTHYKVPREFKNNVDSALLYVMNDAHDTMHSNEVLASIELL